jgi:predicted TIM-barrel fold metal-dependent hydrolase
MHRRDFHRCLTATALTGGLLHAPPLSAHAAQDPAREDALLPIIDTHQHLWDLERQHVPWLDNAPDVLKRSYVSRDYVEATRGCHIVKAIYMEVDVPPSDHAAEADLITRLCRSGESPTVAAVIGGRPGEAGFADYIRTQAKNPYVRGVRQVLHGATPRGYCLQDAFVQSMRLLGELGLLYDLCLRPEELPDAVTLVRQCPDTRFVVDHCGNADPQALLPAARRAGAPPSHDPDAWRRAMAELAKLPHVICKISGVVAKAPQPQWTAADLAPVVNHCLDEFGPERVVFGSDWPVCRLGGELAAWVAALRQILAQRPAEQQRQLLHDNAQRLYRV